MVATRDIRVGSDVAKMAALGKFEDEFAVYAISYLKDGKVWHRVSEDAMELWCFAEESRKENVYPTVVCDWVNRTLVPSGQRDDYMLNTKIMMAKKMKQAYSEEYLVKLNDFANLPNTNDAYALLKERQDQLLGCFDREALNLFEGLVECAFEAKKLQMSSYRELKNWLDHIYQQMEDDIVIKKNFSRTFYGIGYIEANGQKKYIVNAKQTIIYSERNRLRREGKLVTPIWQKTYWYFQQPNLAEVRKEFLDYVKSCYNEDYWMILLKIREYPSAIAKEEYDLWLIELKKLGIQEQISTAEYYRNCWHI